MYSPISKLDCKQWLCQIDKENNPTLKLMKRNYAKQ